MTITISSPETHSLARPSSAPPHFSTHLCIPNAAILAITITFPSVLLARRGAKAMVVNSGPATLTGFDQKERIGRE